MYIDRNVKRVYSEHLYLRFGQTVRLFCVFVCAHVLWDLLCLMHWICSCDLRVCKAVRICILVGKNCVSDLY